MNSDLQVLVQNPRQLEVHSPIALFPLPVLIPFLAAIMLFSVLFYINRARETRAAGIYMLSLLVFLCVAFTFIGLWSHTVTFTKADNDIHIVDNFAGLAYSDRHYPLGSMREAIVESSRPGPRIALLMQSGATVFPLGKAFNPKPSLYHVLILMNDFVHPEGSAGGSSTNGSSSHLDQLGREIEANQKLIREAEERAAKKK